MADAARIAGVTPRTAQRALNDGRLGIARTVGRQSTTDDLAVLAWMRTKARGRKWSSRTRDAALDLLSGGRGESIPASARSRLRSALRELSAAQIASSAWVGVWSRYRTLGEVEVQLIGPSVADLGLVPGESFVRFADVSDLDRFEASQLVVADPDGDLVVLERPHDDRLAQVLVDAYVLGDARESAASAAELRACVDAL